MRKTIELMEFKHKTEAELTRLYTKEAYQKPFVIETTSGEVHLVQLTWHQGYSNNYQFESDYAAVHPNDVAYIEDRIWNHIKA